MKSSTQRNLAVLSALGLSGYFGLRAFTELSRGDISYFLFSLCFSVGMAVTVIAIFRQPNEGKLYNTVVVLGGLPSIGLAGFALWMMFTGSFTSNSVFALITGLFGLFAINEVVNNEEMEGVASAEANE